MGRKRRQDPDGGWHHVMNRGVDRMDIFLNDGDRRRFLELLADAAGKHSVEVAAYCLVGNHFHLLVHCPTGGLSKSMWQLGAEYARLFNHRKGRDGPLFRGRFNSVLVDADEYLTHLLGYIHCNSIDLGVEPWAWPWSSYHVYAGQRACPRWLRPERALAIAGGALAHKEAVARATARAAGQRFESGLTPTEIYEGWSSRRISQVLAEVAALVDRRGKALGPQRRRDAVVLLAVDGFGLRYGDLVSAGYANSAAAARSQAHRARVRLASDPALAAVVSLPRTTAA